MTDSIWTRADLLAHVLEAARADDCVVAEFAERLVDDVLEAHDPYHTDSVVGEVAAVDLLGRMLKWLVRDRRDLSALVECLAVDSGVSLPYVALAQRHPREAGMKRAHQHTLPAPPPPCRLSADFPVLPVIRPTFAPPISRRGEEGFSSCLARPRHRAVATTPPECRSASASLRYAMLLSSKT